MTMTKLQICSDMHIHLVEACSFYLRINLSPHDMVSVLSARFESHPLMWALFDLTNCFFKSASAVMIPLCLICSGAMLSCVKSPVGLMARAYLCFNVR